MLKFDCMLSLLYSPNMNYLKEKCANGYCTKVVTSNYLKLSRHNFQGRVMNTTVRKSAHSDCDNANETN